MRNVFGLNLKEIIFRYNCVKDIYICIYKAEERGIAVCHSQMQECVEIFYPNRIFMLATVDDF